MKYQFLKAKEQFLLNHWVTPMLMTLVFSLAALLFLWIDFTLAAHHFIERVYLINNQTAQLVMSTIATSIITVTGVVFSITVLILSIASNQLGPRLIPNFIRQGKTQLVLGNFIGTFVYCLIVLCFLGGRSVPLITVGLGVILGIISFLILIYFIHYVCQTIQIETILNRLKRSIKSTVDREHIEQEIKQMLEPHEALKKIQTMPKEIGFSAYNGFIQYVDYDRIFNLSKEYDFTINILNKPGTYIITGLPYFELYSSCKVPESVTSQISRAIRIDDHRTDVQDIEYLFEQVSEIAVRALSPGINNPYTAMLCLNILAECIAYMNHGYLPNQVWQDEAGKIRLIVKYSDYEGIIDKTFDRLRQQAKDDVSVAIKMIQMINQLTQLDLKWPILSALQKHAQLIYDDSMTNDLNRLDREDIRSNYNAILERHSATRG